MIGRNKFVLWSNELHHSCPAYPGLLTVVLPVGGASMTDISSHCTAPCTASSRVQGFAAYLGIISQHLSFSLPWQLDNRACVGMGHTCNTAIMALAENNNTASVVVAEAKNAC